MESSMGKRASYIYLLIGYLLGCAPRFCSVRADGPGHPIFAITEENDAFVGRNEHYTQGLKLGYLAQENRLPDWFETLSAQVPTLGIKLDGTRVGFVLGQKLVVNNA